MSFFEHSTASRFFPYPSSCLTASCVLYNRTEPVGANLYTNAAVAPVSRWVAGMAQWWELSPPTNVARVWLRPGAMHVWIEFVVGFLLFSRVFIWPGFSGFPPHAKTRSSNRSRRTAWKPAKANAASSLNISIISMFLLFYFFRSLTACLCVYFKNTNSELLSALQTQKWNLSQLYYKYWV